MSDGAFSPGRKPTQGRVGSVLDGKWRVDAAIGTGGMATVYAATHRKSGQRVAVKVLHAQLSRDPSTRARFLREAYVANAVGHPNIVRVHDDGVTDDDVVYLVLDLLEGETVEARRERMGGRLDLEEALQIGDEALDALAAAHEKGIIHRDVKPDNVFLTTSGQIRLLDFGLARMKDSQGENTRTGVTIGTPQFMPPEQATGRQSDVDARSDVWGVGATLFTAITGEYVHDAPTLHEQLLASATARARPIRDLVPDVPPAVAVAIDRALELERDDRWASAREMQRALRGARGARGGNGPWREMAGGQRPVIHAHEGAPRGFAAADSLTIPAASPASIRRGEAPASAPRSRPDGVRTPRSPIDEPPSTMPRPAPSSRPRPSVPAPMTERLSVSGENPPLTPPGVPGSSTARYAQPPVASGLRTQPLAAPLTPRSGAPSHPSASFAPPSAIPARPLLVSPVHPPPPPSVDAETGRRVLGRSRSTPREVLVALVLVLLLVGVLVVALLMR